MEMTITRVFEENAAAWLDSLKRHPGYRRALNEGGTSSSKCLGRGTRVIMADLTLKPVEDIVVGDKLMGIDGMPRNVLKLYSGRDQLFRVKQARGIDYIVSSNHILSLRENWQEIRKTITLTGVEPRKQKRVYVGASHSNKIFNLPLPEYLARGSKWKRRHKGWKVDGVELRRQKVLLEPYFLGLWLGDGTSGQVSITNSDAPVIDYLKWFAMRSDLRYVKMNTDPYGHRISKKETGVGRSNPIWVALRHYGILDNKRIPQDYLNNCKAIRLELLAGLVDSDGYRSKQNTLVITQVRKELAEDILLLVRSLGCYATLNCYVAKMKRKDGSIYETDSYRVAFVGEILNSLPVKLERKKVHCKPLPRRYVSSIEIEPIDKGDYFGFELDGDHLFLLEDFTVTHNTWSILQELILIAKHVKSPLLISVVSESLPHLKRGCIRDFINIMGADFNADRYNKTEQVYDFGKGKMEFFPADDPAKMRGARRDILFINEANNVSYDAYRELDIRTRLFTFLDWNPVAEFWAHQNGLLTAPENAYIHSTYQDALAVLPKEVVTNIESNKDKDANWWRVYGLGLLGKLEHLIWPNFEIVDTLPPKGDWTAWAYGLDFGFVHPTAIIKAVVYRGELYWEEMLHEPKLTNADLIERLTHMERADIYADSAEPARIEEISRAGWNIYPANKDVKMGLDVVKRTTLHITKGSVATIKAVRGYSYKKNKDGIILEEPVKINDDAPDAGRYVALGLIGRLGFPTARGNKVMTRQSLFK